MTKYDLEFESEGVSVANGTLDSVVISVEGVDLAEIVEDVGADNMLDAIDDEDIARYASEKLYMKEAGD